MIDRATVLEMAREAVTVTRAANHGDAQGNLDRIAAFWTAYKSNDGVTFDAYDVAMMMALLKVARAISNRSNDDNFVDGCGYLSLAGEMA